LKTEARKQTHNQAHLAVLDGATRDLFDLGVVLDVHLSLPATNVTRHSLHSIQRQLLHAQHSITISVAGVLYLRTQGLMMSTLGCRTARDNQRAAGRHCYVRHKRKLTEALKLLMQDRQLQDSSQTEAHDMSPEQYACMSLLLMHAASYQPDTSQNHCQQPAKAKPFKCHAACHQCTVPAGDVDACL
jgi:hypothetical protein